jgi:folate-dependent phosphoribosylglycinamide formyltransferase PurN
LAATLDVAAVFVSRNALRRRPPRAGRLLVNRIAARTLGWPLVGAWFEVQSRYQQMFPHWPPVRIERVASVNDEVVRAGLETISPDLVMVSGTNLVGKAVLEAASRRGTVLNLHTGISPYVKGGPNCTNWCLARGWFHLIGNTVLWLDPGIDSGPLVATERTPLDGSESLLDLHWKVLEHAHDLYRRVACAAVSGDTLPRVPQATIAEGRTFYNADWGPAAIARALWNYQRQYRRAVAPAGSGAAMPEVRLFPFAAGQDSLRAEVDSLREDRTSRSGSS